VSAERSVLSDTVVSEHEEDPRSGRTSTTTDDAHSNAVRDLILQNRRLTVRDIAEVT
jgi:hypothetical protein